MTRCEPLAGTLTLPIEPIPNLHVYIMHPAQSSSARDVACLSLGQSLSRYHSLAPIVYSVGEKQRNTFTYRPTANHERSYPKQLVRGFSVPRDIRDRFARIAFDDYRSRGVNNATYYSEAILGPPSSVVTSTNYGWEDFADSNRIRREASSASSPEVIQDNR